MSGRRVSVSDLRRVLNVANTYLLWRGVFDRQTGIGRLQLYSHGTPRRYEVQQVVNVGGGVRTLHPAGTLREAWTYLCGYNSGFHIGHPEAPYSDEEGGAK